MQPTPAQPVPAKPLTKGQIVVGVIAVLFLLGLLSSALGLNTTSKAYCNSTRSDIVAGRANNAAAERYYRDC